MQCCPRSVKRVGVTWGISGDVCYMYIMLFCTYANHVSIRLFCQNWLQGWERLCHWLYVCHLYLVTLFCEEHIGPTCCMNTFILHQERSGVSMTWSQFIFHLSHRYVVLPRGARRIVGQSSKVLKIPSLIICPSRTSSAQPESKLKSS
jgi:hypothetical protein